MNNQYKTQNPNDWPSKYPGYIFSKGFGTSKKVALTFDDTPDGLYAPIILNLLAQYSVKATFFCMGNCVPKHPEIVRRMVKEGHIVANHTYRHTNLTLLSKEQIEQDILDTQMEIEKITCLKTALLRPPYGALNDKAVQTILALHHKIILWDVDSLDWTGITGPTIAAYVVPQTTLGSIVLMHNICDGSSTGEIQSLPYIIEILRAQGYAFVTVAALLDLQPYQ